MNKNTAIYNSYCKTTGKHGFLTKKIAKKVLKSLMYKGWNIKDLQVYTCEYCKEFHLGTARKDGIKLSRETHRQLHLN